MARVVSYESANRLKEIALGTRAQIAEWIGKGEIGANNRGSFVAMLTQGRVGSWCAALWGGAMRTFCDERGYRYPIKWTHSSRKMLKRIIAVGQQMPFMELEAGDVVCFARGIPGVQGHFATVDEVIRPGVYYLLDGNVGSFKRTQGRVRRYKCSLIETHAKAKLVGCGRLY